MVDCFWTDFVACAEDCGGAPAADLLNVLNTLDIGFDPLAGTVPDGFGDLATAQDSTHNGDPWNDSSPTFTFVVPLRLADRGGVFSFTDVQLFVSLDDLTTPSAGYSWGGDELTAVADVGGVLHSTAGWYSESGGASFSGRDYQLLSAPSSFISALQALAPFEGLELTLTLTIPAPSGNHAHETGTIADVVFMINNHAGGG